MNLFDGLADPPYEPSSGAREGAAAFYDQYRAYTQAGFTKNEAMQLIVAGIQAGVTAAMYNNEEKDDD